MAHGTLANLSTSAFIRTPPLFAEWIVHHLLTFPTGEVVTVLDPTAGEGDLLAPCQVHSAARLYGVEISADRAGLAVSCLTFTIESPLPLQLPEQPARVGRRRSGSSEAGH